MADKIAENTPPYNVCNYCMRYLINDINNKTPKLTIKDMKFISLFHEIKDSSVQETIISLLEKLQNTKD